MGSCPNRELSRWETVLVRSSPGMEMSMVGSDPGGGCPGASCPVGSCPRTVSSDWVHGAGEGAELHSLIPLSEPASFSLFSCPSHSGTHRYSPLFLRNARFAFSQFRKSYFGLLKIKSRSQFFFPTIARIVSNTPSEKRITKRQRDINSSETAVRFM